MDIYIFWTVSIVIYVEYSEDPIFGARFGRNLASIWIIPFGISQVGVKYYWFTWVWREEKLLDNFFFS